MRLSAPEIREPLQTLKGHTWQLSSLVPRSAEVGKYDWSQIQVAEQRPPEASYMLQVAATTVVRSFWASSSCGELCWARCRASARACRAAVGSWLRMPSMPFVAASLNALPAAVLQHCSPCWDGRTAGYRQVLCTVITQCSLCCDDMRQPTSHLHAPETWWGWQEPLWRAFS